MMTIYLAISAFNLFIMYGWACYVVGHLSKTLQHFSVEVSLGEIMYIVTRKCATFH